MARELIALVHMEDDAESFFVENAPEGNPADWIERHVYDLGQVIEVEVFVKGNAHAYWQNETSIPY